MMFRLTNSLLRNGTRAALAFRAMKPAGLLMNNPAATLATAAKSTATKKKTATASSKARQVKKSEEQKKLDALKKKLKKEKSTLKELQLKVNEKVKLNNQKVKERKEQEKLKQKEKKILQKATQPYRKVSAYNIFIKERFNQDKNTTLNELAKAFKNLAHDEKAGFQVKADDYNAEKSKLYKPKPKMPAFGYAAFVKERFAYHDASHLKDALKDIGEEWKNLSPLEKNSYKIDKSELEKYRQALKDWTDERVRLYKKEISA
ncbi:hypothetical protein HYPBUDRAFT_149395 [Hyphopichia burtonii NRRL Y-1933]|uniref:HMG box domain-containing protein n=1 Tax=Hyphopichia burtonii NRRL Y-1933 TaxID=984485 RepID=A0A1E4RGY9_9ASCO|nr:hypothetical protein HYPBUDRAFT_149395 [Hyphopichia burtonii NRRL Y-1933]ODV66537.1 hypothetical protein HYPBUDRAFT_149395 [Hyphopichia burtonii NRRL Y-1933]